jgi:hypothetical protein
MSFVAAVPSWSRRFRLPVDDERRMQRHTATFGWAIYPMRHEGYVANSTERGTRYSAIV